MADYAVWKLRERKISRLPRPHLCGAHLGPNEAGTLSGYLELPPLVTQKVSPFAVFAILVRLPAMNTASSVDFSAMVCQCAAVAFESYDAAGGALLL